MRIYGNAVSGSGDVRRRNWSGFGACVRAERTSTRRRRRRRRRVLITVERTLVYTPALQIFRPNPSAKRKRSTCHCNIVLPAFCFRNLCTANARVCDPVSSPGERFFFVLLCCSATLRPFVVLRCDAGQVFDGRPVICPCIVTARDRTRGQHAILAVLEKRPLP